MRIVIGSPDPDSTFDPDAGPWQRLREPPYWFLHVLGLPVSLLLAWFVLVFSRMWLGASYYPTPVTLGLCVCLSIPFHVAFHLLAMAPADCIIRDKGVETYWRPGGEIN
jgi:hypothetical protein